MVIGPSGYYENLDYMFLTGYTVTKCLSMSLSEILGHFITVVQ